MAADGSVVINTKMDTSGFQKGIVNIQKSFDGLGSTIKKIGIAIGTAFAVGKIVQFGRETIELGSDLAEVQNVVDTVFPNMASAVDEFAKSAAAAFGLSETMAKQYAGAFGAMATSFGFTEQEAYNMSTALTGLAGDVASFYNITQDEAYTKLKSVFSGETETLKDLGVVMTQNALDAYALANGYGKTTSKMSEQEKVALRYRFVMEQLSTASGDFAKTSDSWANQTRLLKLQFDSLKATLGQGLINVFTPIIKVINTLLAKLTILANAFKSFTQMITGNKASSSSGGMANVAADAAIAADSTNALADATQNATEATKEAEKANKGYLSGLDEINQYEKPDSGNIGQGTVSSAGLGATGVDYGNIATGENVVDELGQKFSDLYETIRKGVQPTVDALKKLWNEGLAKLGQFTWDALRGFYDNFLVPVGKWVFGEGIPRLVNALNDGLMKVNFDKINDSLDRFWQALAPFAINVGEGLLWFWENVLVPLGTWTANEIVPRFLDTLSIAIETLNSIIQALNPLFQWFWDNVLLPIAQWTGGVFLSIWDGIIQVLQAFSDWCKNNPEAIQTITVLLAGFFGAWEITKLAAFIQQSGGIVAAFKNIAIAIGGAVAAKIADKAETIALTALYAKDFIVNLVKTTAELAKQAVKFTFITAAKIADTAAQIALTAATVEWNTVCTIATTLTTALGAAIAFLTSPIGIAIVAITAAIAAIVLLIKHWDEAKETMQKFDTWLQGVFSKDWTKQFGAIGEVFNSFFKNISNIWNSIKQIFNGIITFISGVFSGNWEQAWEGIKQIFSGVWNGIVSILKTPINAIIGMINGLIAGVEGMVNAIARALNSIQIRIPAWVPVYGGNSFGFNIPTQRFNRIPYLATGAVIPPNAPFMAVLGDQKRGTNIEAPEDLIRKIVREETGNQGFSGEIRIPVILDGRKIYEAVVKQDELSKAASGRSKLGLT